MAIGKQVRCSDRCNEGVCGVACVKYCLCNTLTMFVGKDSPLRWDDDAGAVSRDVSYRKAALARAVTLQLAQLFQTLGSLDARGAVPQTQSPQDSRPSHFGFPQRV